MIRSARKPVLFLAMAASALAATVLGLLALDAAFPPPLEQTRVVSREVVDADGRLLRAFATPDGRWRLNVATKDVDPQFVAMLIAYEDQRFYQHHGVDPQAMLRAAWQMLTHGRIVSGGSTLTMQVARLLEPGQKRSLTTKITQIWRALQLERRLSKDDILNLYLTHAPYGGNLEGVRSASLAYFGKDPRRLTVSEAALLVALPQLPEKRRPDRNPNLAEAARMRVLTRLAVRDVIGDGEAERAEHVAVPTKRMQLPALAAHLAETALRKNPEAIRHPTTLRRDIQQQLETVARESGAKLGPKLSLAMVMADVRTGEIVGEVGSADYFDSSRSGWIDMTRIPRSPGSTLKPFIYGLAFEEGLVSQETIIEDRPADFYGYRPRNFDMTYQGDVSIREALQLSLNVPAIRLLNSVGPAQMMARFRRTDVRPVMPAHEAPGLAIGLGGLGITLKDLTQLYAALANRGKPVRLGDGISEDPAVLQNQDIIEPVAAWNVTDILAGVQPPKGASRRTIAYKTGTSYGYRDAWSVGYDGRYVLGVWIGRPDNGAVPGMTGFGTAAPVLFEAFARSGVPVTAFPSAPAGAARLAQSDLPISQRRFSMTESGLLRNNVVEAAPQIIYPPEGARIALASDGSGSQEALALKLQGGKAPFRWLANGRPLAELSRRRISQWVPDGRGYSTLTVIDAAGRAATVGVYIN